MKRKKEEDYCLKCRTVFLMNELISEFFKIFLKEVNEMKDFFMKALAALRRFMWGRYGPDELTAAIVLLSCVFTFLSNFRSLRWLYFIAMALIAVGVWRTLSRNIDARSRERMKFLQIIEGPKQNLKYLSNKIRDRKTHCYFKCKNCGATLRIPKGKGKINVTCPKCSVKTQKKT